MSKYGYKTPYDKAIDTDQALVEIWTKRFVAQGKTPEEAARQARQKLSETRHDRTSNRRQWWK
jgi:GTP cyclohydrolase III